MQSTLISLISGAESTRCLPAGGAGLTDSPQQFGSRPLDGAADLANPLEVGFLVCILPAGFKSSEDQLCWQVCQEISPIPSPSATAVPFACLICWSCSGNASEKVQAKGNALLKNSCLETFAGYSLASICPSLGYGNLRPRFHPCQCWRDRCGPCRPCLGMLSEGGSPLHLSKPS